MPAYCSYLAESEISFYADKGQSCGNLGALYFCLLLFVNLAQAESECLSEPAKPVDVPTAHIIPSCSSPFLHLVYCLALQNEK